MRKLTRCFSNGKRSIKQKVRGDKMGLFSVFKKKSKETTVSNNPQDKIEDEITIEKEIENSVTEETLVQNKTEEKILPPIEKVNIKRKSDEECRSYIKENCQQIMDSEKQISEAKIEYQVVTSYLVDIQRIDQLPSEERDILDNAARKLLTLTRERNQYQNSSIRTSDRRFYGIRKYETEMAKEIKNIRETEDYDRIIKNDMRHLEGEKSTLLLQRRDMVERQNYLKKLAIIISCLAISIFLLLFGISYAFKSDMMIPFSMTMIMVMVFITIIFIDARKNRYDVALIEKKLNKAIQLLNKVKIKYINNTSVLDYEYSKFSVKNASELQYLWEQYVKAREEERRYQSNTERLSYYRELLIGELERAAVVDTDVWLYQSVALIDNKEMVEIRHRLNVRRQKLRERIEYNSKIKDESFKEIHEIIKKRPELKEDTIEILRQYEISLLIK